MTLLALVFFVLGLMVNNWLFLLPGTIAHEALHYVVGWFTSAGPTNFTVQPRDGVYGEVWFSDLNQLNAFPVAVAPLLGIPLALMLVSMTNPKDLVLMVIYAWIAGTTIAQAWPSGQDWSIVREYWMGSAAWILGIIWLTFWINGVTIHTLREWIGA